MIINKKQRVRTSSFFPRLLIKSLREITTAYDIKKLKSWNNADHSESLLSEVEPLELLLPESEELLLPLSRDGPEPGPPPPFSGGERIVQNTAEQFNIACFTHACYIRKIYSRRRWCDHRVALTCGFPLFFLQTGFDVSLQFPQRRRFESLEVDFDLVRVGVS